jgi:hypothetical protein
MQLLLASVLANVALATLNAVTVSEVEAPGSITKRQHLGYTNDQILNTTRINFCSDVHQIIVRATGEPPSMGVIGTLATLINSRLPGSTLEWIDYPAVLMPYDQSTSEGNRNLQNVVRGWADKCEGKIVLLGYSQGAQIVGDVMCGAGGGIGLGPHIDPLEEKYQNRIAAIVQMGDPRRTVDKPWNAGTARTGGVRFGRIFNYSEGETNISLAFPAHLPRHGLQRCGRRKDEIVLR